MKISAISSETEGPGASFMTRTLQLRFREFGAPIIYIIISQNIRYLLWNRGFCRSLNNTYPIFLTPCIRCTNHLCDSCDLTDVNPHLSRHCSERFKMLIYCDVIDTRADRQQVWRHNDRLFRRGCFGRFLSTTLWWTVHVFGTELIRSLAIWLAESRDYHLYIYKHGPAATDSYCDVTMAHCSHGYLWTHDIEVGASWRDCDNPLTLSCLVHDFITLHIVVEWFITAHWETKQFIRVLG